MNTETSNGEFALTESAKAKARDFIDSEKQFQLGFLPTEQSNPITATLEEDFRRSTRAGVQCLQRGDRQMPITMRRIFAAQEWIQAQDWSDREEPSPVQVALHAITGSVR